MIVFFINNSIIVLLYSVQGQESTSGGRNPGPFHRRATDRGKEIFIWIYLFVSSKPTTDVLRQRADTGVPARDTTCHNLGWHFIPFWSSLPNKLYARAMHLREKAFGIIITLLSVSGPGVWLACLSIIRGDDNTPYGIRLTVWSAFHMSSEWTTDLLELPQQLSIAEEDHSKR